MKRGIKVGDTHAQLHKNADERESYVKFKKGD